jgi:hypothetical protein
MKEKHNSYERKTQKQSFIAASENMYISSCTLLFLRLKLFGTQ